MAKAALLTLTSLLECAWLIPMVAAFLATDRVPLPVLALIFLFLVGLALGSYKPRGAAVVAALLGIVVAIPFGHFLVLIPAAWLVVWRAVTSAIHVQAPTRLLSDHGVQIAGLVIGCFGAAVLRLPLWLWLGPAIAFFALMAAITMMATVFLASLGTGKGAGSSSEMSTLAPSLALAGVPVLCLALLSLWADPMRALAPLLGLLGIALRGLLLVVFTILSPLAWLALKILSWIFLRSPHVEKRIHTTMTGLQKHHHVLHSHFFVPGWVLMLVAIIIALLIVGGVTRALRGVLSEMKEDAPPAELAPSFVRLRRTKKAARTAKAEAPAPPTEMRRLYRRLLRALSRAGVTISKSATPLQILAASRERFPDLAAELAFITSAYENERYGHESGGSDHLQAEVALDKILARIGRTNPRWRGSVDGT